MKKKERAILERRFVAKGAKIIKQGDQAYNAYLIQSGQVSIYAEQNGIEVELARLGPGQICGEMALISEKPLERAANVKALEDCNLIVITRQILQEKLEHSDPTIRAVVDMLCERIKLSNAIILDKKGDLNGMLDAIYAIESNYKKNASPKELKLFEKKVGRRLNSFLEAFQNFMRDVRP